MKTRPTIIGYFQKWLGNFLIVPSIYCALALATLAAVIPHVISLSDLTGTWRSDGALPDGIRVQSCYVVNQRGEYIHYLTNYVANEKRTVTLGGLLSVSNNLLIDTITNDFTYPTLVPRNGGVYKVIDFRPGRLSLVAPNGTNQIEYVKD